MSWNQGALYAASAVVLFAFSVAASPTSRPARTFPTTSASNEGRPRRVVFILASDSTEAASEVNRAVQEMTPDQWFGVVCEGSPVAAYEPKLQQATEFNKKKLSQFLQRHRGPISYPIKAIELAMKWRPERVWLLTPSWTGAPDAEPFLKAVHQLNAVAKARVNVVFFSPISAQYAHVLWQLADETGGVCLNSKGDVIAEPQLPAKRRLPPPPATKPSILREPSVNRP